MHIPDGFLDPLTVAVTYAAAAIYGVYAFRRARRSGSSQVTALAPVLAAGIFAAQMLNWPIPGGTSLHFVGGALAGILLGPWTGYISMLLVLTVQCLVFHDGGITALGANILNMAVIDVLAGYLCYRLIPGRRLVAAFVGGWLGITLAGAACGVEIGVSGQVPYGLAVTLPVMTAWHAALGVLEGAITSATVAYIARRAPYLLGPEVRP